MKSLCHRDIVKHADHPSHLLITGLPGVGKTTLIRELAKRLAATAGPVPPPAPYG